MPRFKTAVVLITAPNRTEAENIGRALLEKRLAACVQYENIVSQYVWMGETCRDDEIRITVKSITEAHWALKTTTIRIVPF